MISRKNGTAAVTLAALGPGPGGQRTFALAPPPPPPLTSTAVAPRRSRGQASLSRSRWRRWRDDGWQRSTVARLCPRGTFSQVVAYTRQTSALVGTLLDAASYDSRWVLLSPGPTAGLVPALRPLPRDPKPKFEFGLWLVTAPGPG